ncbi:hypothetical protein M422DRAFT_247886 [Sphaerobolus stellatus SS14]|nr:hypothetical protein M422DRAFT_247886 [Sphaerobolus stellatus SS14]
MDDCGDRTASSGVDGEQRTDDEQRGEVIRWRCTTVSGTAMAMSGRNGDDERTAVERRRTGGSSDDGVKNDNKRTWPLHIDNTNSSVPARGIRKEYKIILLHGGGGGGDGGITSSTSGKKGDTLLDDEQGQKKFK